MIDYVSLRKNIEIPTNFFSPMMWKQSQTDDGQNFFWRSIRGVNLRYYEDTRNFVINGKILMYLHDTQVQNLDDIYGGNKEQFISEFNAALNNLFPSPILDIRDFTVSRIDYCINVKTPLVATYIDFMSRAFRMTNTGTRVNFTDEHDLTGSVYVRTTADYRDNSNKNYTLNFYDKSDRLKYLAAKGVYVNEADGVLASNILRLEVQCGHYLIKRQMQKFGISNTFGELLDYNTAYDSILAAYNRVFKGTENADFHTYQNAKNLLKGRPTAQKTLYVATSHNVTGAKYAYGCKQAKQEGIYPYCFLNKNDPVSSMENPMKLIRKKLFAFGVLNS